MINFVVHVPSAHDVLNYNEYICREDGNPFIATILAKSNQLFTLLSILALLPLFMVKSPRWPVLYAFIY